MATKRGPYLKIERKRLLNALRKRAGLETWRIGADRDVLRKACALGGRAVSGRPRTSRYGEPPDADRLAEWLAENAEATELQRVKRARNCGTWRASNLEYARSLARQSRAQQCEKWKAYDRERNARPERSAYCRAKAKTWYAENKARCAELARIYYEVRKDEIKAYVKSWQRANSSKVRAYSRKSNLKRRALKLSAHEPWTQADWQWTLDQFGGLCAYCRLRPGTTIDHVVPLSRGGADAIWNLLPACITCNCSKGPRTLSEWTDRPYLRPKP